MFKSWSYTSYSNWKACPAKAKYQHIDKLPQPKSWALEKGILWHLELEEFLKGERQEVPSSGYKFINELLQIRREEALSEEEWGVDREWNPVNWKNPKICGRAKIDAWYVQDGKLIIIDFKTGKEYASHQNQASLYAVLGFLNYDIDIIRTEMWYLESGNVTHTLFTDTGLVKELEMWKEKIDKMLSDSELKPTPSKEACKWCPFKNNPCEVGV